MPLPDVGASAPSFSLTGDDGAQLSLADLAGRKVLVWFYSRAAGSN